MQSPGGREPQSLPRREGGPARTARFLLAYGCPVLGILQSVARRCCPRLRAASTTSPRFPAGLPFPARGGTARQGQASGGSTELLPSGPRRVFTAPCAAMLERLAFGGSVMGTGTAPTASPLSGHAPNSRQPVDEHGEQRRTGRSVGEQAPHLLETRTLIIDPASRRKERHADRHL